jgi:hypothetical protein
MIGWINLSVKAFIIDSFGPDAWAKILAESGEKEEWISSCPYSDSVTYNLVLTGAKILGVTPGEALEAYGHYFVKYVKSQVRHSTMKQLWVCGKYPWQCWCGLQQCWFLQRSFNSRHEKHHPSRSFLPVCPSCQ